MEENNQAVVEIKRDDTPSPYLIPGAIIVAGALIAGAVVYSNSALRLPSPVGGSAGVGGSIAGGAVVGDLTDDDPFLGDRTAPVTIVEFGDFQCPFCGRLFQMTIPQIKEKYVKTGKARLVYRDFPLTAIHEMAEKSAEASECADEQGKFWQYHDLLYGRQQSLSLNNLKQWAREIGLQGTQFDNCLDSGKYADEVAKDLKDGQMAGVNGTPATFINGRLVSGAVPFAQFEQIIEEELKKVR